MTANGSRPARERSRRARSERATQNIQLALQLAPGSLARTPSAWHDPTVGRYTQPDPLGFVDGPSVYAYAGNAPGEAVDPDGRSAAVPAIEACLVNPLACALVPPAIFCTVYPEKCRKLAEQCLGIFSKTVPANDNAEVPDGYYKATSLTGQLISGGRLQCVYKCKDGTIFVDTMQPADADRACRPTIRQPRRFSTQD